MQLELFSEDPYLRRCRARVVEVRAEGITLDATAFYPLGGGQPGDRGWLIGADGARIAIADTRRDRASGAIVHVPATSGPLPEPGEAVALELDWERRHRHMRMHTALHLLSAVVKAGVTGGDLNAQRGRLDFDLAGTTLDATAINAELAALVAADLPVRVRTIPGAELRSRPELIKTLSVQPPMDAELIRLIEIAGADLQPCGGTHVSHTGEVGSVRVTKIENKGSHNRRVVLAFAEGTP